MVEPISSKYQPIMVDDFELQHKVGIVEKHQISIINTRTNQIGIQVCFFLMMEASLYTMAKSKSLLLGALPDAAEPNRYTASMAG